MRKLLKDWEIVRNVSELVWKYDGKELGKKCSAISQAGYDCRFVIGWDRKLVAKTVSQLVAGDEAAKSAIFGVDEKVRTALATRPRELKKRLVDCERGMRARYIYASLFEEVDPVGGQGYLLFRMPRSNRCIVYLIGW